VDLPAVPVVHYRRHSGRVGRSDRSGPSSRTAEMRSAGPPAGVGRHRPGACGAPRRSSPPRRSHPPPAPRQDDRWPQLSRCGCDWGPPDLAHHDLARWPPWSEPGGSRGWPVTCAPAAHPREQ
jgi:hypothetical protein